MRSARLRTRGRQAVGNSGRFRNMRMSIGLFRSSKKQLQMLFIIKTFSLIKRMFFNFHDEAFTLQLLVEQKELEVKPKELEEAPY